MRAYIEQINLGHDEKILPFGLKLQKTPDVLCISNGIGADIGFLIIFWPPYWKYRQLGTYKIKRPHNFKEGEWVNITIKDGKIIEARKKPERITFITKAPSRRVRR